MIFEKKIKGLFKAADVYFQVPDSFDREKYTVVNYYDMYNRVDDNNYVLSELKDGRTIVNDISKSDDAIMADFKSTVRNEVRRAKKDGAVSYFLNLEDENEARKIFDVIDEEHAVMYKAKGLDYVSIKNTLVRYWRNGMLKISIGVFNNMQVVWHVYYHADSVARLLYSITAYRKMESNSERNALGRVNRMVHFDDMTALRNEGITRYDWGGLGQSPDVAEISKFKEQFGGETVWHMHKTTIKKSITGFLLLMYMKRR